MFYNKKLLEENGCEVPTDWEEFRETARKVSSDSADGITLEEIARRLHVSDAYLSNIHPAAFIQVAVDQKQEYNC